MKYNSQSLALKEPGWWIEQLREGNDDKQVKHNMNDDVNSAYDNRDMTLSLSSSTAECLLPKWLVFITNSETRFQSKTQVINLVE